MAVSTELRDRARFDTLRRRMFREMGQAAKRWGLTWMMLFSVLVLIGLLVRGAPPARLALQGIALALAVPSLAYRLRRSPGPDHGQSLLAGMLLYLACVANTGGIASPFVIMAVPMLFGAALLPLHRQMRVMLFAAFLLGFVAMALSAGRAVGALGDALAPAWGWAPAAYIVLSAASAVFVVLSVYHMGKNISLLYERVALELAARREELCDESEDRTRALEGVAARLAHEVKNPLAAIKGLSTHMARSASDPKMAERLSIVAAEADRLQGIVDGFLSFSRGLEEMQVGPMRPHELAHELAVLLEVRAAEAGVGLEVSGSADLQINADKKKMRQALLNLVLNAVQASPNGGAVKLDVKRSCSGGATIRVIDTGNGMTQEVLERIRRPYYTTREGGTGLGVAVARGLIEQHGGELRYESAPGKGTTVVIELPECAHRFAKERKLPDPAREPPCFGAAQRRTT